MNLFTCVFLSFGFCLAGYNTHQTESRPAEAPRPEKQVPGERSLSEPKIEEIQSKSGWRDALLNVKGLDPRIAVLTFFERKDSPDDRLMVIASEGSYFQIYRLIFLRRKGDQAELISAFPTFRPKGPTTFSIGRIKGKVVVLAEERRAKRENITHQLAPWPD